MKLGNIFAILVLIIIIVVIMQITLTRVEGYNCNPHHISTTISHTNPEFNGSRNDPVTSDVNRWPELSLMKEICSELGYNVTDWNGHIYLLVNEVRVPFQSRRPNTEVWSKDSYVSLYNVWDQHSHRFWWFTWQHRWYYTQCQNNEYTTYTNITNDDQYKFIDYHVFIQDITNRGIRDDNALRNNMRFNASSQQGFSTIEGLDTNPRSGILLANNTRVVTDHIDDTIKANNYRVDDYQKSEFINQFISKGQNLSDLTKYIKSMQSIGINDERIATKLRKCIYDDLNPRRYENIVDISTLINTYFSKYGIFSFKDFIDTVTNERYGPFVTAIQTHNLHNLSSPLFPTNSNCVMEMMVAINGNNIPTVGIDSITNKCKIDLFFTEFNVYSVNASDFFKKIYPTYLKLNIKDSVLNIKNTLSNIIAISPGNLPDAFAKLTDILSESKLNMSFNTYIELLRILNSRVAFDKQNIVEIWMNFKQYYSTIGYSKIATSNATTSNPITPTTLSNWFEEIETHYNTYKAKNRSNLNLSNFFSTTKGDFLVFIKNVLVERSYTMENIKRDINLGMTYDNLILPRNNIKPTSEQFSQLTTTDPISYTYNTFAEFIRNLFGNSTQEGFSGEPSLSQSDTTTLNTFGIETLADESLKKLEDLLISSKINDINPKKKTWENIIEFITAMNKIGVTNANAETFIKLMKTFHAPNAKDWFDVLNILATVNILSYSNVEIFLKQITIFGVKYKNNFELFLENLKKFKANFSIGLIPLVVFLYDMNIINSTYKTDYGTRRVNIIINYFSNYRFDFNAYVSNSKIPIDNCPDVKELPEFGCRYLLYGLYLYDKGSYYNDLQDIKNNKLLNVLPYCDAINGMNQAVILVKYINKWDSTVPLITVNIANVISFLYKEEYDAIIYGNNSYDKYDTILRLMQSVAEAIIDYTKNNSVQDVEIYTNIYKLIKQFPFLSFQYIANEIKSKCHNDDCIYSIRVNPDYTYCKASTKNGAINFRKTPPIL